MAPTVDQSGVHERGTLLVKEKKNMGESGPHTDSAEIVTVSSDDSSVSKKKLFISLFFVFAVAVAWVSATQFSKYAVNINPEEFNATYFMLWFNTAWMMACYPLFLIYNSIKGNGFSRSYKSAVTVFGGTYLRGFFRVLLFLVLWSLANYTYLKALGFVSASVATSISSCNTAIVWLLALFLLGDKFSPPKLLAVVLAIGGVVLISLDGELKSQWEGIVLVLVSALFTALYKVLFKKVLGDATLPQVSLFMSCLGLLNVLLNGIPTLILLLTGVEWMNITTVPWVPLVGSSALGLLFNFLINFGIALLHPLVISVGMLVGLPLNTVVDIIFSGVQPTVFFISGSACIILSFLLVVFPYSLVPVCKKFGFA